MAISVVLATGSLDHKIRFWDAASGLCSRVLNFGECQVNCLQISLDKRLLLAGGNPNMHLYDLNSNDEKPVIVYEGHTTNITALGFERELKWVYSGSEDGSVRVWDIRSNRLLRSYTCGSSVNTVILSPNESVLISGDQNGSIKVWDLELDKCSEEVMPLPEIAIRSLAMTGDNSLLVAGSHRGKVFVYGMTTQKGGLQLLYDFQAHDEYLLKCAVSPRGTSLSTTSADKTIKLWDLTSVASAANTGNNNNSNNNSNNNNNGNNGNSPTSGVSSNNNNNNSNNNNNNNSSASPNSPNSAINANNIGTNPTFTPTLTRTLTHHQKWVWDAVYSSESIFLVTASSDTTAKLWNVETGEILRNFAGHTLAVTCVALNDYTF